MLPCLYFMGMSLNVTFLMTSVLPPQYGLEATVITSLSTVLVDRYLFSLDIFTVKYTSDPMTASFPVWTSTVTS